jgi:hypothetical protein
MTTERLVDLTAPAARATDWLVTSGVQVVSADVRHHGGFVSWYDADLQSMPYVYSEITGYLATFMCACHARTGDPRTLASAAAAGDWLLRTAHPETGGFRCLWPLTPSRFDYKVDQIYTFDTGVIVSGLVNLYLAGGETRYLDAAVTAADWLLRVMRKDDGLFLPVYDIARGAPAPESTNEWSLCAGAYHTKVALGLLNLFTVTGTTAHRDAAVAACDAALALQQPDGRFVTFPPDGGTNCHPHAYAAEGLWVVGRLLERDDFLDASARATAWLLAMQSADGMIPRHWHDGQPVYHERVDVLCQTLRLAAIHLADGRIADTPALRERLDLLVGHILASQMTRSDPRVDGGFAFGRLSNGTPMPHVNVWVTAFAAQALAAYDDVCAGRPAFAPRFMV